MTPEEPAPWIRKIVKMGFGLLDLICFFTGGADEVGCWKIGELTWAPWAAGVIHADFEKGFICADVTKHDDFVKHGSEKNCKEEGK